MSVGLLALLDDVAGLAKVAAASVDDVIGHAAKAGAKSAGVLIDDAAVTPRYVVGFAAERELPIIVKITKGSLRNKLVFLLPIALLLALFAPWAITPLLMLGGLYLSYEGAEKVYEVVVPHKAHAHEAKTEPAPADAAALEDQKVKSAINTDFILSAEIMAITLSAIPDGSFLVRAAALALVGVFITLGVYGSVALIVKADDIGLALARREGDGIFTRIGRAVGIGLVRGMPVFLRVLAVVGTAAMIWVGGGILLHGVEAFGLTAPAHFVHELAVKAGHAVPESLTPAVEWLVGAAAAGAIGLAVGLLLIPILHVLVPPVMKLFGR
ncbi:MAG: DUF808 domain-containing protein [Rhodobacteraceae bacterium]|nr:DUF808 domain-containing protein [Paracoccaceae bacterium]